MQELKRAPLRAPFPFRRCPTVACRRCCAWLTAADYFIGADFSQVYSNVIRRAVDDEFYKSYSGSYFGSDFNGCSNLTLSESWLRDGRQEEKGERKAGVKGRGRGAP